MSRTRAGSDSALAPAPTWFDEHQGLRAVLMFVAMIGVAGTGSILIRRLNAAPDQTIGPLGSPVYG